MPQWIGTASPGAITAAAAAARAGSRWPGPRIRSPAPDRQQCQVDGGCEVRHLGEEIRVTREVDGARSGHDEPDRLRPRPEGSAAPVVHRKLGDDPQGSHLHRLVELELVDVAEPAGAQPGARPCGSDDRRRGGKHPQRGEVGVVGVKVREQHRVDALGDAGRRGRRDAHQRSGAAAQKRIGEQRRAVELQAHGRVTDPAYGQRARDRQLETSEASPACGSSVP